jgi:hypothetical protein
MKSSSKGMMQKLMTRRAENMTPGWSAYGGQTRSAYETGPPPDVAVPKPGLEAVRPNNPTTTALLTNNDLAMRRFFIGSAVGVSAASLHSPSGPKQAARSFIPLAKQDSTP